MKKDNAFVKKWLVILLPSLALLIMSGIIMLYYVLDFNSRERIVTESSPESDVYVDFDTSIPKGERWTSYIQMSDNPEDMELYTGETVTCTVYNNNRYNLKNWTIKITPGKQCYLNGFWGGSVEVHQFRNGEELIETLNGIVAASEIERLDKNHYIDSMMINLLPGDYIIYVPSVEKSVDYIQANDNISIVFNFYYDKSLDFSNYSFSYYNDVKTKNLLVFKIVVILWAVWGVALIFFHAVTLVNKRIVRDLKNADQNLSAMADLYTETYRINLDRHSSHLINRKNENALINLDNIDIQEGLNRYVDEDCFDLYSDDLKAFFDLSTLNARLEEKSSIVFEYKSNTIGWCSVRFFKLPKSIEDNQFVLAVQDINEERRIFNKYEEHIRQTEKNTLLQGDFLDTIFYALNGMVSGIRKDIGALEEILPDNSQQLLAASVSSNIEHLLLLGNFVHDLFDIKSDRFKLGKETYNIYEMIETLKGMIHPFELEKDFELQIDIDSQIPQKLAGDRTRIMQILVVLLSSSMIMTESGFVKLSVFGKRNERNEELLFSVRDTTNGFTEEQLKEIDALIANKDNSNMGNAAYVYFYIMDFVLKKMGSGLKIVSVPGSGNEFYFSINQEIVTE